MRTTTLALAALSASTITASSVFPHLDLVWPNGIARRDDVAPVEIEKSSWNFHWGHGFFRRSETCKSVDDIEDPIARIDTGLIIGQAVEAEDTTINRFLGIPFAKPPKRFEKPEPAEPWASNLALVTKKYSPACVQQILGSDSEINKAANGESENCLYLNVWQPTSEAPEGGFPVMFWIYGGSLEFGDAGMMFYEGSKLAALDTVVVTINYRTNIFGFPGSPDIDDSERNLGFFDQRLALDWVQRNIEAFNGNPDKVTIFGESAGGLSVDSLVNTMTEDPPFWAAIVQSGTASLSKFISLDNDNAANWKKLVELTDCADADSELDCIKAVPALTIKELIEDNALTFYPVEDEVTLASNPLERREKGDVAQIPMMFGTNKDEGRLFVIGQDNLTEFLTTTIPIPALQDQIAKAYPIGTPGLEGGFETIAAIWTDLVFTCPNAAHTEASVENGIPTWRYYYSANFTNLNPYAALGVDVGAAHALEIPLVFGNFPETGATEQQEELSKFMRAAWTNFAKDPTGAGPGWPAVGSEDEDLANLGAGDSTGAEMVTEEFADSKCDVFQIAYAALGVLA